MTPELQRKMIVSESELTLLGYRKKPWDIEGYEVYSRGNDICLVYPILLEKELRKYNVVDSYSVEDIRQINLWDFGDGKQQSMEALLR